MNLEISKKLNNGALWSAIAVIINSMMNFFIIPLVSNQLGVEAYGFVTLANTMITYIDIISLAINSFSSRYIAIEYHKGKKKSATQYFTSIFVANIFLSVLIIIFMIYFVCNIKLFLNISDVLYQDVRILFGIVFIRYILVLLRSVFEVPPFIVNRIYKTERIRSISYIIQSSVLVFSCIYIPAKIWYVGVASLVAALFMLIMEYNIAHTCVVDLRIEFKLFEVNKLKKVLLSGVWNSINNLGNQLNSGLDLLITNRLLSGLAVGMISISKTFGSMCYILVNSVGNAFKPRQLELFSKGDKEGLILEFKKAMRITGAVCIITIVGFYYCGIEFLELWIPEQDIVNIFRLSVITLSSDVITSVVNPLFYAYTLTDRLRFPCIVTLMLGVINVCGMYVLIVFFYQGMYAVVMTTMLLNLIHFVDTPLYATYCLKIPYKTFYPTILRYLLTLSSVFVLLGVLDFLYPKVNSWLGLAIKIFIFAVSELLIVLLLMADKAERIGIFAKIVRGVKSA